MFELILKSGEEDGTARQVSLGDICRDKVDDVALLGLGLSEIKQLLMRLQHEIVTTQFESIVHEHRPCACCGVMPSIKPSDAEACAAQVGVAALGESETPAVVGRSTQEIAASVAANREEICGDLRRRASVAAPAASRSLFVHSRSYFVLRHRPASGQDSPRPVGVVFHTAPAGVRPEREGPSPPPREGRPSCRIWGPDQRRPVTQPT